MARFTTQWVMAVMACAAGCSHHAGRPATAVSPSTGPASTEVGGVAEFALTPLPPDGWPPKPLERDDKSIRQVWVHPNGRTGYGIIRFKLPLPFGPGMTLPGFISETERQQGPTRLLDSESHQQSGGVQFVADLPLYRMRGVLWTRGFTGWVVYATTDRAAPVEEEDLKAALRARNATLPAAGSR